MSYDEELRPTTANAVNTSNVTAPKTNNRNPHQGNTVKFILRVSYLLRVVHNQRVGP